MKQRSVPVVLLNLPDGRLLVTDPSTAQHFIYDNETQRKEKIDLSTSCTLYLRHRGEGLCNVINRPLDDVLDPDGAKSNAARERVRRRLGERLGLPVGPELDDPFEDPED